MLCVMRESCHHRFEHQFLRREGEPMFSNLREREGRSFSFTSRLIVDSYNYKNAPKQKKSIRD